MGLTCAHTQTQSLRVTGLEKTETSMGTKGLKWRKNSKGGAGTGTVALDELAWEDQASRGNIDSKMLRLRRKGASCQVWEEEKSGREESRWEGGEECGVGAPGWLSWLSIRLGLRSGSQGS